MSYEEPSTEQVRQAKSKTSQATRSLKRALEYLGPEHDLFDTVEDLHNKADELAADLQDEVWEREEGDG